MVARVLIHFTLWQLAIGPSDGTDSICIAENTDSTWRLFQFPFPHTSHLWEIVMSFYHLTGENN